MPSGFSAGNRPHDPMVSGMAWFGRSLMNALRLDGSERMNRSGRMQVGNLRLVVGMRKTRMMPVSDNFDDKEICP